MEQVVKQVDVVKEAEQVMQNLLRPKLTAQGMPMYSDKGFKICKPAVTTSQLRKFLTAVNMVTNKVNVYRAKDTAAVQLPPELVAEVQYLKVKIIYQAGKEDSKKPFVSDFVRASNMIQRIDAIGDSIKKYENFARYVEALVAYHKFYGGRDN